MRIPDPKANTTTEAYLAYKAGYLEESELKPVLYEPYLHFDAWLAYWAGLTNTYPTDKNGNPEMLTDEEALVAYLSGATNTYPEEIRDPYDVRIVGYLRHLASIRFDAPEYPITNEEFYLSNLGSTTIDSGEPSSDIELDNTAEFAFTSVEMYGDAQQNEYTGKNLFNKNGEYIIGNGNPIVTQLDTGIKMEYNTSGSYPFAEWIIGKTSDFVGQTLTASADVTKSAPGLVPVIAIGLSKADGSSMVTKSYVSGDGSKETSWTVTEDSEREYIFMSLYVTNQGEYSQGDYTEYNNAQIEIGSTKTSYEPFVGGTNSPNPDYPQDVNVATGTQNVTSYGKNILNPTISSQYPDDRYLVCSSDEEDNRLTLEAVGNTGSQYCALEVEVPDANKTYTLTGLAKKLSKGDGSDEDDHNTLWVRYVTSEDGVTWTTDYVTILEQKYPVVGEVYEISGTVTGHKFYRFMFYNYNQNSVPIGTITTYYKLQLEEGDTATLFSKYKDPASYEIDLGSLELCKIGKYQDYIYQNDDGDWYVHKEIEKYTFTGTETWEASPYGTNSWRLVNVIGFPFDTNELQIICNIFTGIKEIDRITAGSNVIYSASNNELNIRNTNLTSLAEVQSATNGNYVYYALVTPTDTKITDSGLVGQLNALKEGGSYEGKTYIKVTATDPNLPALLKVEAYKY